jgi:hypothetical protein
MQAVGNGYADAYLPIVERRKATPYGERDKGEAVVKIRGVQVVKEQTADAALLLAVLEIEVLIAPAICVCRSARKSIRAIKNGAMSTSISSTARSSAATADTDRGRYDASGRHPLQSRSRGLNQSRRRTTTPALI